MALKLSDGPHLFTDWRYVLAADVWGGFYWASKETEEVIPVRVYDEDGQYADGPIDAKMKPTDLPRGIGIVAQQARKSEPFPRGEPPGGRIIYDEGLYRTWHFPTPLWQANWRKLENSMCYAESDDGLHWRDQSICTFDWSEAPEINVTEPPTPFFDPSAPDEERFKLVFLGSMAQPEHEERRKQVLEEFLRERPDDIDPHALSRATDQETPLIIFGRYGAVSPDGIQWKVLPDTLMLICSDAQNLVYYDTIRESYVWYLKSEWYSHRRCIARAETKDFRRWPLAETIVFPGPDLHPSDDWYTNSKTIYPGTVDQHLMFPALYHHFTDLSELRMFTSSDGVAWAQVPGGAVLSPGETGAWDGGFLVAGADLVPLPDEQVGLQYGASYYPHKYPRTKHTLAQSGGAYALWTRERLAALEAEECGSFATVSLLSSARKLRLNVQTKAAGEVLVEAAVSRGAGGAAEPLPGNSFDDCVPIAGDHLDHIVTWRDGQTVNIEQGQPFNFRFRLRSAKLFAFELLPG